MICGWCGKPIGLVHPCAWTQRPAGKMTLPPLEERARRAIAMWEAGYDVGLDRNSPPLVVELAQAYLKEKLIP